MKKIYEAKGEEKREIIEIDNECRAHDRLCFYKNLIGAADLIMVGKIKEFPFNSNVNIHWSLNGLIKDKNDSEELIIIEPLEEQMNNGKLVNISEVDTYFNDSIELSDKAIILMSTQKYNELCRNPKYKDIIENMNVRLYEGEEELAVKMFFSDKDYIYLDITKDGYSLDEEKYSDTIPYLKKLLEEQKKLAEEIKRNKKQNIIFKRKIKRAKSNKYNLQNDRYRMITGLTNKVEGDIELDDECYASTDIGKRRQNQEDALLLIKDKEIPDFKMLVVADGMGGWQSGEIASDAIVNKLKEWFENLDVEKKKYYYSDVRALKYILQEKIEKDIQAEVESKTWKTGGSTLVCAIIGKNNTLISNIGDSRAYVIKDGRLKQISIEDTVAQKNLEEGKTPNKEALRFDRQSNKLLQCLGMSRRELIHPHFEILNNNEYDMLLLFSDGVTDCLSDNDITVVCKNSNREEVTKKLVEKAIRNDSIEPEEFSYYNHLTSYIPGGKDNATAVAYVPKKDKEIDR